jgi:hypothetical protein
MMFQAVCEPVLYKVVALVEHRFAPVAGQCAGEAIAEVQPGRLPLPLPESRQAWRGIFTCSTVTGSITVSTSSASLFVSLPQKSAA